MRPVEDPYEELRADRGEQTLPLKGSGLDTEKAAGILLDDFRNGRLGRITLEIPENAR